MATKVQKPVACLPELTRPVMRQHLEHRENVDACFHQARAVWICWAAVTEFHSQRQQQKSLGRNRLKRFSRTWRTLLPTSWNVHKQNFVQSMKFQKYYSHRHKVKWLTHEMGKVSMCTWCVRRVTSQKVLNERMYSNFSNLYGDFFVKISRNMIRQSKCIWYPWRNAHHATLLVL